MGSLTRGQRLTVLLAVVGTAAAGTATYGGAPDVLTFVVAGLALAALAFIVSFSTEQVGARFGPAVTGVLQSTLGNLPEFFIVLFALHDGQVVVAQTSVVGSLFANALLVLGVVIIVGARRDGTMRFRPRLPQDTATLLLSASFVIVLVALAVASHDEASKHVTALSAGRGGLPARDLRRVAVGLPAVGRARRGGARAARRRAVRRRGRPAGGRGRGRRLRVGLVRRRAPTGDRRTGDLGGVRRPGHRRDRR
jgi:hypothetical protein